MLKNKFIAIVSTVAMLFSVSSIVNAAESTTKTKIITAPTFFVQAMGYNNEEAGYEYCLGVNYTYTGEDDPITYTVTGSGSRAKYSGVGFKVVSMDFDYSKIPAANIISVYGSSVSYLTNADSIKVNGHIDATATGTPLNIPDLDYADGPVFFYIYTDEEVSTAVFDCTNLTVNIVDYGTTPATSPTTLESVTYSSDTSMVDNGLADFYAYTAAAAPAATITGVTIDPTSATVNGGESQTFTATVSGTGAYDSTVTYSATAGTITSAGVFTAPAATDEAQTITVTATANGDNTKTATATVTVPAAAPVVPVAAATVDAKGVVKGSDMFGQNTAVTKLGFANTVDPFVRITLGGVHKDYELPAGVKGGSASLIAILRYAKGTVGTFTIAVMDGGSTLIETTHVATDE